MDLLALAKLGLRRVRPYRLSALIIDIVLNEIDRINDENKNNE